MSEAFYDSMVEDQNEKSSDDFVEEELTEAQEEQLQREVERLVAEDVNTDVHVNTPPPADVPPAPLALDPDFTAIPEELRREKRWVVWVYDYRPADSKPWTKVPSNPHTGKKALSNVAETWGTFVQARHVYDQYHEPKGRVAGVGYMLGAQPDGLFGLDLDKCRDTATGTIEPWAVAIINRLDSYTEVSPSGTGVRIFARGTLPPGRRKTGKDHPNAIELYDNRRFLTVTGQRVQGTPTGLQDRQDEINAFHRELFPPEPEKAAPASTSGSAGPTSATTQQILDVAFKASNGPKVKKLWDGEWVDTYQSESDADMALCAMLAFYSGSDKDKLWAVFKDSPFFKGKDQKHLEKWDRPDYRDKTLAKAIDREEFYNWNRKSEDKQRERLGEMELELEKFFTQDRVEAGSAPAVSTPAPADTGVDPQVEFAEKRIKEIKDGHEAAKEAKRRRGYTMDEIDSFTPLRFIIKKHLVKNTLACLYGPSGVGKSFVALDYALCMAYGKDYLGEYRTKPGKVVYVSTEGKGGIKNRIHAWRKHHEYPNSTPNFIMAPVSFKLTEEDEAKELLTMIKKDLKAAPDLIIIDTLARNYGGDEDKVHDMSAFVENLEYIKNMTGATVLVVHHTGKDTSRGERGSSAFRGACDTSISVDESTDGKILVACEKQKDGAEPFESYKLSKIVMDLGEIEIDGEMEEQKSLVWVGQDRVKTRYELLPKPAKELLATIKTEFGSNDFVWGEAMNASGHPKATFSRWFKML